MKMWSPPLVWITTDLVRVMVKLTFVLASFKGQEMCVMAAHPNVDRTTVDWYDEDTDFNSEKNSNNLWS